MFHMFIYLLSKNLGFMFVSFKLQKQQPRGIPEKYPKKFIFL